MREGIEMRNIQQGLICGLVVLFATGCAWDSKELPAQAAEVPAAAPQTASQGMDIHRMFEIAKKEAVVADLPAQF
jgi:hypothetical protein